MDRLLQQRQRSHTAVARYFVIRYYRDINQRKAGALQFTGQRGMGKFIPPTGGIRIWPASPPVKQYGYHQRQGFMASFEMALH